MDVYVNVTTLDYNENGDQELGYI